MVFRRSAGGAKGIERRGQLLFERVGDPGFDRLDLLEVQLEHKPVVRGQRGHAARRRV